MYNIEREQDVVQITHQGRAYGTPTAMLPAPRFSIHEARPVVKQLDQPHVQSRIISYPQPTPQPVKQVSSMITGGVPTTGISPTEVKTRGQDETWYPGMLMSKGITAIIIIALVAIGAWAGVTIYTNYVSAKTLKEGGITTVETPLE